MAPLPMTGMRVQSGAALQSEAQKPNWPRAAISSASTRTPTPCTQRSSLWPLRQPWRGVSVRYSARRTQDYRARSRLIYLTQDVGSKTALHNLSAGSVNGNVIQKLARKPLFA